MDPTAIAQTIASFVTGLTALDRDARRPFLAALYKELQSAGLPESVAAALQHQLARAAEGAGEATHTVILGSAITPAGDLKVTKE